MTDGTDGSGGSREARGEIEIDAPVEAVWRALTEARELERWFPLEAEVEPGPGGRIRMSWGNEYDEWMGIEVWDPPTHLRTSWGWGEGPTQVTDYHLEAEGGRTRLRVVTSGFPDDATWDDMVEGTRLGWLFELRQLKHYLESHAGRDRRAVFLRRRVPLPRSEAWARLEGLGRETLEREMRAVFDRTAPWQLAAITEQPPGGMLRITVDPSHDDPSRRDVSVWIAGWGGDAERPVKAAGDAWAARLEALFPEGEARDARV